MQRSKNKNNHNGRKFNFSTFLSNWGSVLALIVVSLFFIIRMPDMFLSPGNITTIFRSISVTTVMAIGLTVTLAVGGFDLSAGAMASLDRCLGD